jgi:beta-lactamase regulating signal transducer with metallopeptidase domain
MNWLSLQTLAQISIERILNALPEGLLIAFFAWALLRVLRKQSSGTRFAVWFLALVAVAALPVLAVLDRGQAISVAGMSPGAWGSMRPAINIPARWAVVIFVIWFFGACLAMTRLGLGFWRLSTLRQSCSAIDLTVLDPTVRKTIETIAASGRVTIATSDAVRVPAAIGFWKPTIILPPWVLRELLPEDLNVILLHEFAHLRRGDDWTNLIQKIVGALFFFHPAVWWIDDRLSVEREMACDDAVLAETSNPHGYATCLVSLLEKSLAHRLEKSFADKRWSMAQAAIDRAREASLRLARILDANRPMATRIWRPALGMVGAFALLCLAVLPVAPQFVGFDQGAALNNADRALSATVTPASLPKWHSTSLQHQNAKLANPTVIPAGLRMDELLPGRSARVSRPKVATRNSVHVEGAALRAEPTHERVLAISADTDQEIVPQFQTLVFFEATQYRMSDSTVWSVRVWRVMLVSPVQERLARVPVTNSI